MPQNLRTAAFVLGAVLLLIAVVGGRFKIFGAEVSGEAATIGRLFSAVLGVALVFGTILAWPEPSRLPRPPHDEPREPEPELDPDPEPVTDHYEDPFQSYRGMCVSGGTGEAQCDCIVRKLRKKYSAATFARLQGTVDSAFNAYSVQATLACTAAQ